MVCYYIDGVLIDIYRRLGCVVNGEVQVLIYCYRGGRRCGVVGFKKVVDIVVWGDGGCKYCDVYCLDCFVDVIGCLDGDGKGFVCLCFICGLMYCVGVGIEW